MSWSMSKKVAGVSELDGWRPDYPVEPEAVEQIDAAVATAKAIVAGGTIGGEGKLFFVSLSGHANPGHEPRSGWSNDCITVSVSQASP